MTRVLPRSFTWGAFAVLFWFFAISCAVAAERVFDFDSGKKSGGSLAGLLTDVRQSADASALTEDRIVVFSKDVPRPQRFAWAQGVGGSVAKDLWLINALVVSVPSGKVRMMERSAEADPRIVRVDKDFRQRWLLETSPAALGGWNDRKIAESLPWNIKRVHAPDVWSATTGAGIRVAILDTGVSLQHRALVVAGGYGAVPTFQGFSDDEGHGTRIAGIVAAQDDDSGVIGVSPGVSLYAVKVLAKDGGGTFASIIDGLQWCVSNRMNVVNMSFGSSFTSPDLAAAIHNAAAAGLTLIAASGNSGNAVVFPAAYPEVIAVGASDMSDKVPSWSNRGPQIAFIAPGVTIRSTTIDGEYGFGDGTSDAVPHVTGLAAIAMSIHGISGGAQVRGLLQQAAAPLPGFDASAQGAGMIDARPLVQR